MIAIAKKMMHSTAKHFGAANESTSDRDRDRLRDHQWIVDLIRRSQTLADGLASQSDDELRAHTSRLRDDRLIGTAIADKEFLTLATASVIESIRRTIGWTLFDVQIHVGLVVAFGAVAEMQTGEGKTLAGVLPAYLRSLSGRGVHVATTNSYLAIRDHETLTPVFEKLGLTTGVLKPAASLQQTQTAYRADVTYGPGHAFGFDYLRDQLVLQQSSAGPIGTRVINQIDAVSRRSELRQRGLHCAIVDEIDQVLIDDARSPLLLSSNDQGAAPDSEIHIAARELALEMKPGDDFSIARDSGSIRLTDAGFDRVYQDETMAIHDALVRPWHEYVVLALRANHVLKRDVDYIVRDQQIQLIDSSTGRIFTDRNWSHGLHQAAQASQRLTITPQRRSLAKMTRQHFYRQYQSLGGMTGTAADCRREFQRVYELPVHVIPTRLPSQRQILPEVIVQSQSEKYRAIAQETKRISLSGRPVLIGTLDIAQSNQVAQALADLDLEFQLLNGVQDASEAAVIATAGQHATITVATNLAGRGTDIKLSDQARSLGGLHVIVTERHTLARVDRQLVGRCARCGDPGTATFYLSPDDKLPATIAPWIGKAIRRQLRHSAVASHAIISQLHAVQGAQQRRSSAARMQLMKSEQSFEATDPRSANGLAMASGCWRL